MIIFKRCDKIALKGKERKMSKNKSNTKKNIKQLIYLLIVAICVIISFFYSSSDNIENTLNNTVKNETITYLNINEIPEYTDEIYVTINNNVPYFDEDDYTTESFETYSDLDSLGRCGVAYANICTEIMPTKERGDISDIYPTGWIQKKYEGEYLYNRCHLIGHQLVGEDANEKNLITGTKYFNVSGMLPFENRVANYIDSNPNNHVLYRVTPIFEGDNLVAKGVQIEAYSVEDNGKEVCFNVFVYNVQPGINIDYATGKSWK